MITISMAVDCLARGKGACYFVASRSGRSRVTVAKAHRQGETRKENPMKHDTIEILGCLTFGALLCALVILMLAC